jgi:hypothetical protein
MTRPELLRAMRKARGEARDANKKHRVQRMISSGMGGVPQDASGTPIVGAVKPELFERIPSYEMRVDGDTYHHMLALAGMAATLARYVAEQESEPEILAIIEGNDTG